MRDSIGTIVLKSCVDIFQSFGADCPPARDGDVATPRTVGPHAYVQWEEASWKKRHGVEGICFG